MPTTAQAKVSTADDVVVQLNSMEAKTVNTKLDVVNGTSSDDELHHGPPIIRTPHGKEYKALATAKNVLIVTPAFPPNISFGGGVAITYDALARRLEKRGAKVTVLSPQVGNMDGASPVFYPGFTLIPPNPANLQRIWHCVGAADVVVVPDSMIAPYVIFIGRVKHTPVINNVHTNVKSLLINATSRFNPIPYLVDFFLALNTWLATVVRDKFV